MRYVEKSILLQTLDHDWREHIVNLDHCANMWACAATASAIRSTNTRAKRSTLFEGLLSKLRARRRAPAHAPADQCGTAAAVDRAASRCRCRRITSTR
jgi:hypothetical protein